jgi:RpiR family transcriptional regulator, repressor of rpiB and als operon
MTFDELDLRAVGPKIRMRLPSLTPLELRVVETVFGQGQFSEATALRQIADDAGVSEALVVKIAKKLGFAGFRDFRSAVAEYIRSPTAEMHEELRSTTAPRRSSRKCSVPPFRLWRKRSRS